MAVVLLALVAVGCAATESLSLSASAPFVYAAPVEQSLQRVAIVVTITNRSDDDLLVNPADFAARDGGNRIYTPNVAATVAEARLVRYAGQQLGMEGLLPLSSVTLRKNDVLSGFVVFDVPAGVRPVQLIFRQSDVDHVVELTSSP